MPYPARLGDPCWDVAQVGKVIAVNAQTSATSVDYFLAAHSPFRFISNLGGTDGDSTEEDVYQDIFSLGRGEVQAAIRGEPGTGKSHLVHWLKLRADFDAKTGNKRMRKFVRVLVQRGNGSLKYALQQIVAQLVEELGPDFQKHLQGVQNALDQLSESTARATLLSELALEIDNRWTERNRPILAPELVPLADFLRSAGTRRWLLRSGGTIDEVIRRLTELSTVEQRESPPAFQAADLTPEPQFLSPRENGERVRRFCEDLEVDEEFRIAALTALNTALPDAIGEMTGLGGSNLFQIFHEIRRELADRKRELALFIEDVSVTAAGLDRDVINALEPQERTGLCRMVAVLGMTPNAWERLAKNQQDRIKPLYDVGAGVTAKWAADADEIARFTARYLNAIRSDDRQMHRLAEARYQGDVPKSICDECPVHDDCFKVFGHVKLDNGVDIGIFPFTPPAPQALLTRRVTASSSGIAMHTQRDLLGDVLQPILDDAHHSLQSREFPRSQSLRVRPIAPSSWTGFENRYLGGWDSTAKDRIRWLAQFWILAGDADELASALGPLLKPLGLPSFAAAPRTPVKTAGASEKTTVTAVPLPATADPLLRTRLEQIEEWRNGGNLRADGQFRELLYSLITSGIRWEDERQVPHAQFERYVNTTAFPRVEGQTSQPANQPYFLDLPRDAETRALLEALVRFRHAGNRTWNFEHGELHKRIVSCWLRKHRDRAVTITQPPPPITVEKGIRIASHVLAIAARLRDRKALTSQPEERLAQIFEPVWTEEKRPVTFSPKLGDVVRDLERRHGQMREFLVRELGAAQGRAEPKDFIDPQPIVDALKAVDESAELEVLPPSYQEGTARVRFVDVAGLGVYTDFAERLKAERAEFAARIDEVRRILRECQFEQEDLREALLAWLPPFLEVIELQRGGGGRRPILEMETPTFEAFWQQKVFRQRGESWGNALRAGNEIAGGTSAADLLEFNPATLDDAVKALRAAHEHLEHLERYLSEQEQDLAAAGAGDCDVLLSELGAFPLDGTTAPEDDD